MSDVRTVTVTIGSREGFGRAIPDSVIEAYLTFTCSAIGLRGKHANWKPREEKVKQIASVLVMEFTKTKDEEREWHESYLREIEEVTNPEDGASIWRVVIVEPETD